MNLRKNRLLLFVFILLFFNSQKSNAQYKHYSLSAFGQMSYVPCKDFLSSPGARFQFNFKKVFSVSVSYNHESMKFKNDFYQDQSGDYLTENSKVSYDFIAVNGRASFGRRVLLFVEAGLGYAMNQKLELEYTKTPGFSNYDPSYISNMTTSPENFKSLLPFAGVGVNFPIYKYLHCEVNVSRSFYHYTRGSFSGIGINYSKQYNGSSDIKRPFAAMKFSFSLVYQFNFKKNSKFSFTTFYPKIKTNHDEKVD